MTYVTDRVLPNLDALTERDLDWFQAHPLANGRYRRAEPPEMIRFGPDEQVGVCLDETHYRVFIGQLSTRAVARCPSHRNVPCKRDAAISEVTAHFMELDMNDDFLAAMTPQETRNFKSIWIHLHS